MKVYKIYFLLVFAAPAIYAKENADDLKVNISVGTQLSDNGRRHINNEQEESEWQDKYNLGVVYGYSNEWSKIVANYSASRWTYSINSQPDYTTLVGDATIDLGGSYQPAHIEFTNSRRSLLKAPDALDVSDNRDERAITKVEPSLKFRLSDADLLSASVNASDISYANSFGADSRLTGGQLAWMREISQIEHFRISANSSKAAFQSLSGFDYKFDVLSASYAVDLRNLHYRISAGENRATMNDSGEEFKRPVFDILVGYSSPSYTLDFTLNQKISNSSAGDGNSDSFAGSGLDAINSGLDLINFNTAGLLFSTTVLCDRCKFSFAADESKEEYKTLLEDSATRKLKASFSYAIGRRGTLQLSFAEYKRTFSSVEDRRNFTRTDSEVSYAHSFISGIKLKVFARRHENDSELSRNVYNENVTGLNLGYDF